MGARLLVDGEGAMGAKQGKMDAMENVRASTAVRDAMPTLAEPVWDGMMGERKGCKRLIP